MPMGLPRLEVFQEYGLMVRDQLLWLVKYMDIPDRTEYVAAMHSAYHDAVVASSSLLTLGYLTTRPWIRLFVWVGGHVWTLVSFLAKLLLSNFYYSSIKGFHQAKWIWRMYWSWQISLNRREFLIQGSLVVTGAILYLLRKYIQQKKYYERTVGWYKAKKRSIVKSYQSTLRKISHTSLLLAMLLPHVLFLAVCGSVKLLFPRVITYIATETYLTTLLGTWYPLIWTISLLYHYRHRKSSGQLSKQTPLKQSSSNSNQSTPAIKSPKTPAFYPKTTPMKHASTPVQRWLRAASTPSRRGDVNQVQEECTYWLHYWIVVAVLSSFASLLYSTPFMGRLFTKSSWMKSSFSEIQLLWYLWIFSLPASLTSASIDPTKGYESRPLPLVYRQISPLILSIYNIISNAVPQSIWDVVCEKIKSVLSICVMVRLLSEESKDALLHSIVEARPLLPPAMTLFTPFTGIGVLYVKSIVPAARYVKTQNVLSANMSALEFWVLHTLLSGILQWWNGVLWWIPFSSHVVFLVWCHIQLPKSCAKYYTVLEEELQAFGLLDKGDKELEVQSSLTARIVSRWIQSLPSASNSDDDVIDKSDPDTESKDAVTNDKENEQPVEPKVDSKSKGHDDRVDESSAGTSMEGHGEDNVSKSVKATTMTTRRSSRIRKG